VLFFNLVDLKNTHLHARTNCASTGEWKLRFTFLFRIWKQVNSRMVGQREGSKRCA